jgi:class 3 adenylate cyclase
MNESHQSAPADQAGSAPEDARLGAYTYDRRLVRPAHLRFTLPHADGAVQIRVDAAPAAGAAWEVHVERPGRAPRRLILHPPPSAGHEPSTWLAPQICERLRIPVVAAQDLRQDRLEPVLAPLLQLSPASPCFGDRQIDRAETIEAVVAFADLRGFSDWCLAASPEQITGIFDVLSDAVSLILADYQYHYWKLLGDGVMLVWRVDGDARSAVQRATAAMRQLIRTYANYRRGHPDIPTGFGAAISLGPVIEFVSSKFFDSCLVRDYLGPVVNRATRLQGLAKAGRLLVDASVAAVLPDQAHALRECTAELASEIYQLSGIDAPTTRLFEPIQDDKGL